MFITSRNVQWYTCFIFTEGLVNLIWVTCPIYLYIINKMTCKKTKKELWKTNYVKQNNCPMWRWCIAPQHISTMAGPRVMICAWFAATGPGHLVFYVCGRILDVSSLVSLDPKDKRKYFIRIKVLTSQSTRDLCLNKCPLVNQSNNCIVKCLKIPPNDLRDCRSHTENNDFKFFL